MIHELRIYQSNPGRMPALLDRFENVVMAIWKRHGFRQIGFWTSEVGPSNQLLYYILAWESWEEREQKLASFRADSEWIEKFSQTEKDGPLIKSIKNSILKPTKFSSIK